MTTTNDVASIRNREWETPVPRVSWWDRFAFESVGFGVRLMAGVFSLTGLYHLARGFATAEWLINYKRRRRYASALRDTLGMDVSGAERRRATWRHFVRTRCDKLFSLLLDHLPPEKALARFEIVNRALLDDALAGGHGAYVALSHLGAHHVAGALLVQSGYKVAGVRAGNEGALRRYLRHRDEQSQTDRVQYLYTDTYPRRIYRLFEENYVLGSAIDVHRIPAKHLRTAEVTVLGERRRFLAGPMQIALRCKARILQGFVISRSNFRFALELRGPLVDPGRQASERDALAEAMRNYGNNLEGFARQYPCHISRI